MKSNLFVFALLVALPVAPGAHAATATFSVIRVKTTPEEVANGALAGGDVYKYLVTTDADILSVSNVQRAPLPSRPAVGIQR